MRKKVGLLGGTFNPPHIGHLIMANEVLEACQLDEVRFLPNRIPPHKELEFSVPVAKRIEMVELAIQDHPHFTIERIESERSGPSYTYDTIQLLRDREPEVDFYFIIGGDMVEYLPKWNNINELKHMVRFVGVNRPQYPIPEVNLEDIIFVTIPGIDLSSSLIRERLKNGESVRYLIPFDVLNYIKGEKIYG